jgi:hypothetical protein
MPNSGNNEDRPELIEDVIKDRTGGKTKDKGHYFYIIQVPLCGANRIKIGKSSDIRARFKYYQAHFHSSKVKLLELRKFNNTEHRWSSSSGKSQAMQLYALYEREAQYHLRNFNKKKTKTGLGELTEWFDADVETELMNEYWKFPEKFRTMKFDKTEKRKGLKNQTPYNISDDESSSSESETEDETPVVYRRSTRNKNEPNRYKP